MQGIIVQNIPNSSVNPAWNPLLESSVDSSRIFFVNINRDFSMNFFWTFFKACFQIPHKNRMWIYLCISPEVLHITPMGIDKLFVLVFFQVFLQSFLQEYQPDIHLVSFPMYFFRIVAKIPSGVSSFIHKFLNWFLYSCIKFSKKFQLKWHPLYQWLSDFSNLLSTLNFYRRIYSYKRHWVQ